MGNTDDSPRPRHLAVPPLDDTRRQRLEVRLGAILLALLVLGLIVLRLINR